MKAFLLPNPKLSHCTVLYTNLNSINEHTGTTMSKVNFVHKDGATSVIEIGSGVSVMLAAVRNGFVSRLHIFDDQALSGRLNHALRLRNKPSPPGPSDLRRAVSVRLRTSRRRG